MTSPLNSEAHALLSAIGASNGVVVEHSGDRAKLISRRLIRRLPATWPTEYAVTKAGNKLLGAQEVSA